MPVPVPELVLELVLEPELEPDPVPQEAPVTATATASGLPGALVGVSMTSLKRVVLRAGADPSSAKAGTMKQGQTGVVLGEQVVGGMQRIQFEDGWTSNVPGRFQDDSVTAAPAERPMAAAAAPGQPTQQQAVSLSPLPTLAPEVEVPHPSERLLLALARYSKSLGSPKSTLPASTARSRPPPPPLQDGEAEARSRVATIYVCPFLSAEEAVAEHNRLKPRLGASLQVRRLSLGAE